MALHMSRWKEIRLSTDPLDQLGVYIDFLKHYVSQSYIWENEACLQKAVRRYEQVWLPLAEAWRTSDLEPPRDVKWVWHLHMLNPRHYEGYCRKRFGRIIPHRVRASAGEEKHHRERTSHIWSDRFPYEPFELATEHLLAAAGAGERGGSGGTGSGVLPVILAARHQSSFLYQVSLPHYRDGIFQRFALDRYRQFLYLQKMQPGFCAEPPYDIQLVWRVHMLHPGEYVSDTAVALRRLLDPHDAPAAASLHSTQVAQVAQLSAEQAWLAHFDEPLFMHGTVYRGAHYSRITPFPKELNIQEVIESCEITIDDLCISELWSREKNIFVECRRLGANSFSFTTVFKVKGKVGNPITSKDHKGLATFSFDSKQNRGIELFVYSESGFCSCTKTQNNLATVQYNPRDKFETGSFFSRALNVEIPKVSASDAHVKFTCHVRAEERKAHTLTLTRDPFQHGVLPRALLECVMSEPSWGRVLAAVGADTEYMIARHGMKSQLGKLGFGIEVVKHEDSDSSAVLVYLNNKQLLCIAHTVAPDQCPASDRVSAACPLHMDPDFDHAMLVRNHAGGWAMIKASWLSETTPGFGKVQLTVYHLASQEVSRFTIRDDEMQTIKLSHVSVDMPTGRVTLGVGCQDTAENIALAFCVGVLFLTCQRKAVMAAPPTGSVRSLNQLKLGSGGDDNASDITGSESVGRSAGPLSRFNAKLKMQQRRRTKRRKMSASFTFLLACGLQIESYYHSLSQPTSRNSTITLNDVPVIVNKDGDVKFAGNMTPGNGHAQMNGSTRINHNQVQALFEQNNRSATDEPKKEYEDIRL